MAKSFQDGEVTDCIHVMIRTRRSSGIATSLRLKPSYQRRWASISIHDVPVHPSRYRQINISISAAGVLVLESLNTEATQLTIETFEVLLTHHCDQSYWLPHGTSHKVWHEDYQMLTKMLD
jgi:hypothetical protein